MSLFLDPKAPVIVQGITGRSGEAITQTMLRYGTVVAAGVTPGKGGEWLHGLPVFDNVFRAVEATGAVVSLVAVPAEHAADAVFEAIDGGVETVVCVTERIPIHDVMRLVRYAQHRRVRLLGPSSAGLMMVGEAVIGLIPTTITLRGGIGIAARGGSLLYHVSGLLQRAGLGMSALISTGSDLMCGMTTIDVLEALEDHPDTEQILLLTDTDHADVAVVADYIRGHITKPVAAMMVGRCLPATISFVRRGLPADNPNVAEAVRTLESAGVRIADYPEQLLPILLNRLE